MRMTGPSGRKIFGARQAKAAGERDGDDLGG